MFYTREQLENQRREEEKAQAWIRDRAKYQKERAEKNARSNSNSDAIDYDSILEGLGGELVPI